MDHRDNDKTGLGDEAPFGFDCVVFDLRRDDTIGPRGVTNALVTGLDVAGKVLADEPEEQGAKNILLEVPCIHSTTYFVGDLQDLAL
jgi:hypothetical protein